MFRPNPLGLTDGYKIGHQAMLAPGTEYLYGTWIPRSLKHAPEGVEKILSAEQQLAWMWLHDEFEEGFFKQPIEVAQKFGRDMSKYLNLPFNGKHFEDLHELGYLPIRVKALPEGIETKPNIPHQTFINTVKGFAWLTLYLETPVSGLSWKGSTNATIAMQYRRNATKWVMKTDSDNAWFIDYACHDFAARGLDPFTTIASGLAHAMSFIGSDTLIVIDAARYFYGIPEDEVCIASVNASEHSVTCTGIFYYRNMLESGLGQHLIDEYYSYNIKATTSTKEEPDFMAIAEWANLREWLKIFPTGILSVVSDTFDLFRVITEILPRLKAQIMARDGKLVIRPDSGDPVDITCGLNTRENVEFRTEGFGIHYAESDSEGKTISDWKRTSTSEVKGVIELLWDIFGGTVSKEGYKVLDPHIGAIYGDSINLKRQVNIYKRLASKGFASTNIVLGVGSYTYQLNTRDTFGFAAKASWFQANGNPYDIYKDPATDDGTKKSLRGFCQVFNNRPDALPYELKYDGKDQIEVNTQCTKEQEEGGLLEVIYENGKFYNQVTLTTIRERISKVIHSELETLVEL
jgi:nicotinamide phosphoribosyltransferase